VGRLPHQRSLNQHQYAAESSPTLVSARRYGRILNHSNEAPETSSTLMPVQGNDEDGIELVIGDTLLVDKRPDSWVVKRDGTRTPLALKLPVFDPRERPWYREAVSVPG